MDERGVKASLNTVIEQIRHYVPIMAPYFELDTPLGRYAAGLRPSGIHPVHRERQEIVVRATRKVLRQAFGTAAEGFHIEARDLGAVNIVDHHQLLNHPLLIGSNIIANADRLQQDEHRRRGLERGAGGPIVTFSCSNVPPSNPYMRYGFEFRGETIPYFARKENRDAIYYTPLRPFDFVERLRALRRWDRYAPADQAFLIGYQELLNGLDCSHTNRHRDQLAVAVRATWPQLFSEELRANLPELLYANSEDVTRECLMTWLGEDNFLSAALFDPRLRQQVLDGFRGNVVAWDEERGKGTHFFWRKYPGRPELLRLYVEGDQLVPADPRFREFSIPLTRAAVREHLEREEIIPSIVMFVSALFYAGIKPLVGYGSLVYTTQLKERWAALLARNGFGTEADRIAKVDTGGLIAGTPMFFHRARASDMVRTLSAADVFRVGGVPASYIENVLKTPFRDLLSVGSSGLYELFASSYIPNERQVSERASFDDAATVIHTWL